MNEIIYNAILEIDDFKKLKIKYPDLDNDNLIMLCVSLGCVAANNRLFNSLFNDMLYSQKLGLKD